METLAAQGYKWFTHFSSVDLPHDMFCLEVCAIHEESDAKVIMAILEETFPDLNYTDIYYYKYQRDRGWKAMIFKNPRPRKKLKIV